MLFVKREDFGQLRYYVIPVVILLCSLYRCAK
jgi:hypothetical protein